MRRMLVSLGAIGLLSGFIATPPAAAQQSVDFYLGGFVPHDYSNRGNDDVLFQNGSTFIYDFHQFRNVTVGAEYLVGLGDYFDAGLGAGFYSSTAPAVDLDEVFPDGSEIRADFTLRITPVWATVRFLPLGHHDAITPYVGAGVGIYNWRYTEAGDFVADSFGTIVHGSYSGSGTNVGPVILGGVKVPIGRVGFGGEVRYQGGEGNLPADQGFSASKINLGGFNYLFTFSVKF